MKLGLSISYSGAHLEVPVAPVQRAEELGYHSVWSAEAYGSDAITPLAFLAAKTNRIKLGTGIVQMAARTQANGAMSTASIDAMSGGGRFIAGLGDRDRKSSKLVRPAMGQALLSGQGLRRDHAQDLQARKPRASVHVEVDTDVKGALMRLKPEVALYAGGIDHQTKNFHNDIMARHGFGDAARRIQELYLAGHKDEAIAARRGRPACAHPRTLPCLEGQRC